MIGSSLKKFAAANGMKTASGVVYGNLGGYAATMFEGMGYKALNFTHFIEDPADHARLLQTIHNGDLKKQFRVSSIDANPTYTKIVFSDTIGTMEKINGFVGWYLSALEGVNAIGISKCIKCGGELYEGQWVKDDQLVYFVDSACARQMEEDRLVENEEKKQTAQGSYLMGALGALLGAAVGALLWAIVLSIGFIASIVGLAIAFLAAYGYTLFGGKEGKGKIAILIVAIVIGVLLGTALADAYGIYQVIQSGGAYGLTTADIPDVLYTLFVNDADFRSATLKDLGMGFLFAALGAFGTLKNAGKQVADKKFILLP